MVIQQAVKILGLAGNESSDEINSAYQTKLTLVEAKCQSAPTEALKQKFEQFKIELSQAQQVLTAQSNAQNSNSQASNQQSTQQSLLLSQTKIHDLPGAGTQNNNESTLEIGSVLAERYQIKAFIAQGGMGAVYRAFDKNRNEDIAIKVMLPQLMQNESARERFLDEARLSSQLSHPNIVNVFDVIQDNDLCFITMELLEGQDLRQLMENRKLVRQNFSLDDVIEILEPICAGLDHAHELTVHRDIKPENIYLTEDGKYKLMDFGIAKVMSTSQRTQTGAASGTAYYMAPEQLKGAKNIDGRADQYALAVLTYELLSGEVPAGAIEPLHEVVKGINKKVSLNVQKALSPKPGNRFDNLTEFLTALKGKNKGAGISMPTLPMKGIGIAAAIVIAIIAVGGVASTGGLTSLWDAIKPVDKALIAQQKSEAQRILNDKKAGVAKLQGEIKNYQKRLNNGQRNLKSEIRDAERNKSKQLGHLQDWQELTNKYIFDGDKPIELEGELSKGQSLLKQGTTVSIAQANTILTQVRDGYKNLWAQFNAAEHISQVFDQSTAASFKWMNRQSNYQLDDPKPAIEAVKKDEQASKHMKAGDFVLALSLWRATITDYGKAYQLINQQIIALEAKAKAGKFTGCLRGDCQNGKGTFFLKEGEKYVGKFVDGKRTGQGTITLSEGQREKLYRAQEAARIERERIARIEQQQKEAEAIFGLEYSKTRELNADLPMSGIIVTVGSNNLVLLGQQIQIKTVAPDFKVVDLKYTPVNLSDFYGKKVIVGVFPSVDIAHGENYLRMLNEKASDLSANVVIIAITSDLPFAQKMFLGKNTIDNVKLMSDSVWQDFGEKFGVTIKDMGVLTTSLFIIDEQGILIHKEIVPNLISLPNLDYLL
jgi:serine/threonine protein kinase/peroxiredoxin